MSRVRLRIKSERDRYAVFRAHNPNTMIVEERPPIPALRLLATVLIGQDPLASTTDRRKRLSIILDTGAPLSIFPFKVWSTWPAGSIECLELSNGEPFTRPDGRLPNDPPESFLTQSNTGGGGTFRCWLGRVWLGVIDDDLRKLPAIRVTSWFVADPNHDRSQSLLGLHQSILDGRRLLRTWDADGQESFHQQWFLEL